MDKRQVVLEHREAQTVYLEAMEKHRGCASKNVCGKKSECLKCPAFQAKQLAAQTLEEKTEALRAVNAQIVLRNEAEQNKRVEARKKRKSAQKSKKQHKGEVKMARKVITVDQYKELVAQGLKMHAIAEKLGVSAPTLYARKSAWTEQGLLGDVTSETKQVAVAPEVEVAVETAKAPEAEPSVNYEALYKKMFENFNSQQVELKAEVERNEVLQQKARAYEQHVEELEEQLLAERDEIERLRAQVKHLKHAQHTNVHRDNARILQLEAELAEMVEEVSNACYEKAEIERKYDRLARMAGPILKDWTEALLKEVNG